MTKTQHGLLEEVIRKLDNYETGASFANDKAEDDKIKQAIKLWLETWIRHPIAVALDLDGKTMDKGDRDYYKRRYGR